MQDNYVSRDYVLTVARYAVRPLRLLVWSRWK